MHVRNHCLHLFFFLEPILNWHSIAFFLSPDPTSAHLPIFRGMRCRLLAKMMSSFNFLDLQLTPAPTSTSLKV